MVDHLYKDCEFWIITRDRDLNDLSPYADTYTGQWVKQGKAYVYYIPQHKLGFTLVRQLLRETPHDILYLNSFFSRWFSFFPLFLRRFGQLTSATVVLAPRGELMHGALKLRSLLKNLYFNLVKCLGLHRGLIWHASTSEEAVQITTHSNLFLPSQLRPSEVFIAPDLLPIKQNLIKRLSAYRPSSELRVVFLSRISPMKNIDFLLRALTMVKTPIKFFIFGPREDSQYWELCKKYLENLPPHINVILGEDVRHDQVMNIFAKFDLFAFPTRGENFGHVIFESLATGTPVLISDQTPWKQDKAGSVEILPLIEEKWCAAIESWSKLTYQELMSRRAAATSYANSLSLDTLPIQKNIALFDLAMQKSSRFV